MKKIYKTQAKQVNDPGRLYLLTHYTPVTVTKLCPHQNKHRMLFHCQENLKRKKRKKKVNKIIKLRTIQSK